jgi:glycine dehydrogenase subunit 1
VIEPHPYLSLTDRDREEMLGAIGVSSVEELFRDIPEAVRFRGELELEPPLGEAEIVAHLTELASRNAHTGRELSFLGAGIYDHYVPAFIDAMLGRGEFLTAYTPYQPEMSQGTLQAIFEYQTVICELTGMDVSNASGYDGPAVTADACYIAKHATGRSKVVLAEAMNPQVRQVVKTYAPGFGLEVVEVPHRDGVTDPDELRAAAADAACVVFQQPNFFGCLEAAPELAAAANEAEALPVARTWIRCRSASSRRPAATAARSPSARGSPLGTTRRTEGPTTDSSPRGRTTCGGCPGGSSARRPTSRASAATC